MRAQQRVEARFRDGAVERQHGVQCNPGPKNELAKIVAREKDDAVLANELFLRLLAREATKKEIEATQKIMATVDSDNTEVNALWQAKEKEQAPLNVRKEKEREAAIRASFTINGPDQVIVSPAIKDSSGTVRKGQIHALIEGAGEDGSIDGYVTNTGEFVTREQAEGMSQQRMGMDVRSDIAADEIQDPFRRESYLESELKQAGESEIPALVKQIEATRAEINAMGYDLVGDKYVQTRASEQSIKSPEYQAFVKERIDKYVAEQKKLFDVEYQKKLAVSDAAREKQTIGPLAKPEDIAKLDGTRVPEAAIADIAEDARALSADAEADLNVLEVENPELADHIRKEIKKQMGAIDDPQPKAIEAALNCLINE